jgi:hypothetical protein
MLVASYGQLPLHCEPNQEQADTHVGFLSRGQGYTLLLTSAESEAPAATTETALRMRLVGANSQPEVVGLAPLPG